MNWIERGRRGLAIKHTAFDAVELLTAALADRYAIQEELGVGGTWMNIE